MAVWGCHMTLVPPGAQVSSFFERQIGGFLVNLTKFCKHARSLSCCIETSSRNSARVTRLSNVNIIHCKVVHFTMNYSNSTHTSLSFNAFFLRNAKPSKIRSFQQVCERVHHWPGRGWQGDPCDSFAEAAKLRIVCVGARARRTVMTGTNASSSAERSGHPPNQQLWRSNLKCPVSAVLTINVV